MEKIKRTLGFIFTHPLAKRHPVKSLSRFVYWQLQCLVSPSVFKIKAFVSGIRFYAKKGSYGLTGNIYTGLHEFEDMAFLLHFLKPGEMFFDIGANAGSYTLLASGVAGAKTIALEPATSTFNILTENIKLNALQGKAQLINAACGGVIGELSFSINEDTTNHVVADDESNANIARVQVITVDSLLNAGHPSLIKIDVEGFETEVLKGMEATLKNTTLKAIIIELNGSGGRYGYDDKHIHQLLLQNNFKPYGYNAFDRTLTGLPSFGSYNTIYCRDIEFVIKQIKAAAPIKIMGELI